MSTENLASVETEVTGALELKGLPPSQVVEKFRRNGKDTGSPEVQIALITRRLQILSEHFKKHAQDVHSQRGMMMMISARKGLLQYLRDSDPARYRSLIGSLGLRK